MNDLSRDSLVFPARKILHVSIRLHAPVILFLIEKNK